MALPTASDNEFPKVIMEEVADDGSATVTPAADHRALFLGEDGLLHVKDSSGTVTDPFNSGGALDYIRLEDQKTQNTAGGTFTSGAWQTRTLNTEVADTGNHCTLASNQFTLAAGTYEILAACPAAYCDGRQARLQNVTAGTTLILGQNAYSSNQETDVTMTAAVVRGVFTVAGSQALEIQHRCQSTRATNGFGSEMNWGTEVYTVVELWRRS